MASGLNPAIGVRCTKLIFKLDMKMLTHTCKAELHSSESTESCSSSLQGHIVLVLLQAAGSDVAQEPSESILSRAPTNSTSLVAPPNPGLCAQRCRSQ